MHFNFWPKRGLPFRLAGACLTAFSLAACGGGGGATAPAPVVEATVLSVTTAGVLEGQGGIQNMVLTVTLDKPVVSSVNITYFTSSTAKAGAAAGTAGFADGGAACTAGVDFVMVSQGSPVTLTIAAGSQVATLPLNIVCGDATFEPNETFAVTWSAGGVSANVVTTIINDDVGGLNSPGVATVLGGGAAFGRDTHPLTNSAADGALGFSFANTVAGGCRVDQVTGLTWSTIDVALYTQAAVAARVVAANTGAGLCDFIDWRVPGVEELASLVDHSRTAAPVNADTNATSRMAGKYWSNDGSVGSIVDQMVVDFTNLGAVDALLKTSTANTRLVRGTALVDPCNNARYMGHGDGTVSDSNTGLMWKQCPEGLSGAACAAGTAFGTVNSGNTDAVTQVAMVNDNVATRGLGYSDWRIPSRNELASLVCRSALAAPLINSTVFPANGTVSYLTSTPHPAPGAAWFVNFDQQGSVGANSSAGKRLRLVRAGQ